MKQRTVVHFCLGIWLARNHLKILDLFHGDPIIEISQKNNLSIHHRHLSHNSTHSFVSFKIFVLISCQVTINKLKLLPQDRTLDADCSFVPHCIAQSTRPQLSSALELIVVSEGCFDQNCYVQSSHGLGSCQKVSRTSVDQSFFPKFL